MPATQIANPATGESLLGIEPALLQQVNPGWRSRLNCFTGRTLTATSLSDEQSYRAGLLATLGQAVTAGVVKGLALSIDTSTADPVLTVTPGYGIAASGEDVNLLRTLQTNLSTIAVVDAASGQLIEQFKAFASRWTTSTAGFFVLQPIVAQVSGQAFDTGPPPTIVSGNLGASCDQDPAEYAFEDWQIADGTRLVFLPWVDGVTLLQLPSPTPAATWRNRLAYAIFSAEAQFGLDTQFPWMMLGVPVALSAFDQTGKLLFFDCASVVRPGGLPRRRYSFPALPQLAPVWQPNNAYFAGTLIVDSNGNIEKVQTAGQSGAGPAPPKWATAAGATTADNGVTWVNGGIAAWQPNAKMNVGQSIFDASGNAQTVLVSGITGGSQPQWNDTFLQTTDNSVTWVNNGTAIPPIVQPGLAMARVQQLAEQVADQLGQSPPLTNLAQICTLLPPSGILPVAAVNFLTQPQPTGVWFPPNWALNAAPVLLEELEAVLQTGMLADPIPALTTGPSASSPAENVEILVPLPDTLYDPDILVTETVAPDFQNEINNAVHSRNATLHTRKAIQLEVNALVAALGPNVPSPNPNAVDLNANLTPAERAGRDALPPAFPQPNPNPTLDQTFGTLGPSTWQANTAYVVGQFIIDSNGNIQKVATAGTSGAAPPVWSSNIGATTPDGASPNAIAWLNNGTGIWQPNTAYTTNQFIFDVNGSLQIPQANGTSGASQYIWNLKVDAPTQDGPANGGIVWNNDGPAAWQAGYPYKVDQVVVDSNGNLQVVQSAAGKSGGAPPIWSSEINEGTSDNDGAIIWINEGPPTLWLPNTAYAVHKCFVDPNNNIQEVQTAGTSGASQFIWNPNSGASTTDDAGTTSESPLKWLNAGPGIWQPNQAYSKGQFVLDSNGNTQTVQTAGESGSAPPAWNANVGQTTTDSGVTWTNCGVGTWQPNAAYAVGAFVFDSNGNVQTAVAAGTSGGAQPPWSTLTGQTTQDGTSLKWVCAGWASADLQNLQAQAAGPPYVVQYTDTSGTAHTIPLISSDDWTYLGTNGLQSFISYVNAKIKQANDMLDLAFLTTQTDIYRFRQGVLSSDDATRLATSTILANIATGDSATSTAQQLQTYLASIIPGATAGGVPSSADEATAAEESLAEQAAAPAGSSTPKMGMDIASVQVLPKRSTLQSSVAMQANLGAARVTSAFDTPTIYKQAPVTGAGFSNVSGENLGPASIAKTGAGFSNLSGVYVGPAGIYQQSGPVAGIGVGVSPAAPSPQITQQQPISGAQLDVRTLTIAERLAQSPSQESLFYAIADRYAFMQALAALEITTADLPFLVDAAWQASTPYALQTSIVDSNGNIQVVTTAGPSGANQPTWKTIAGQTTSETGSTLVWTMVGVPTPGSGGSPTPIPTEVHWLGELQPGAANASQYFAKVQSPYVRANIDEGGLFSTGVRVVEQHSQLMRALEGRVQTYVDFVSLCSMALANVQNNVQSAQTLLQRLDNDLSQTRQDVAFTTALLGDEQQRVANVNAQRQQVLATSVQVIAYTRPRTLETMQDVPSRQLVPGNVVNPVPTCLQQSTAIPPELREVVALLSDAPANWFPPVATLVSGLSRPSELANLASDVQARAAMDLALPLKVSSALATPSVYGPAIAGVYAANQQVFRGFQVQRSSLQPSALATQSWSAQVGTLTNIMGIGDLTASEAVHTEIANSTARIVAQVGSVATCVYTRANLALPVDRLAWAEFLSGSGLTVQLQSLAILPNWNAQPYTDRQQMQLLVDWLFSQIDASNAAAAAFMSDVVRVSILLASHAPVNDVIAGAVLIRNQAVVGSRISLTLPSTRIAAGMYVQLFSKGNLAAQAVVSDLDSTSVTATITKVTQPGGYLEANDVAHFTSAPPQVTALRAFAG
jgi:hypothetical protein